MKFKNYILLLLCCSACSSLPKQVRESLDLAGENREELEKVLEYYSRDAADSLKFWAACFLIENMRWHISDVVVQHIDPQFGVFCRQLDSLYYPLFNQKAGDSIAQSFQLFRNQYSWLADSIRCYEFQPSETEEKAVCDLTTLDRRFLIGHIDNAFWQWQTSPFAKNLNFKDFCECILPYRCMWGYPLDDSGEVLNRIYGKYVNLNDNGPRVNHFGRYNFVVQNMRKFLGESPQKDIGIYGLYFNSHECTDIANYGCNVLRACGIPVMIEFNDAYRDFAGRHFYCVTRNVAGEWQSFNPESSLPGDGKPALSMQMNLYRQYYGVQKDSPFFLKALGEYLPPLFNNPCLREVTGERTEVFRVILPFVAKTSNRLAYLAAFQAKREMAPVTWGQIDTVEGRTIFANVMPGRLYFPVYYEDTDLKSFSHPFYIERDTMDPKGYDIHFFGSDSVGRCNVTLIRKFPRKPNMIDIAKKLVGATFIGANKGNFSDARTLFTITAPPVPYLQDFIIRDPVAYRYYRFTAPDKYPHANVAMLEFLTDRKYGYKNVMRPTPRAVLCPHDTVWKRWDVRWVKLLDKPSWDEMKCKAEYDGNMQTAPSAYKTVNMRLKESQIVHRIRFAPKNADNGIRLGEEYELFCWNDGWESCGRQVARYEYLEYKDIPAGKIFWLRNYSSGKEELPFVIKDGKQLFFYYELNL